jgi:hypothetical protein
MWNENVNDYISSLLVSRNKEPAFIFYPPPLVSLKYQKGQNFFEARENFSYVYLDIYIYMLCQHHCKMVVISI